MAEINNIIGFSFEDGGFFEGYRTIEVDIVENKVICKYRPPFKKKKIFEISNTAWNEFVKQIIDLNILAWKEKYNDPDILDGEQWGVYIKFFDGKTIEIQGNNDYPKEWDAFKATVKKYFRIPKGVKTKMDIGKVYVVHNEWVQNPKTGEMPYKIGITKNSVENRYYGLGLKMPGEFVCDFAYEFGETYSKVENALHKMLNPLNVNGEWFNVNEETLDGIHDICELAGGKLITEEIEEEIEKATGNEINHDLKKIIDEWNKISDTKAMGRSQKWRNIYISGIKTGVHYQFRIRNSREISIQLGCWTKAYNNFDQILKSFNGLEVNGHIFEYLPPSKQREKNNGWKGRIRAILSINEINDIIDSMNKFIELTRDKIINACNEKREC